MANVAVRNWRFLYDLGITGCRWFEGVGNYLEVRKLATIGGAAATIGPDSPTVLTLKVLYSYPGEPIDVQGARGRIEMMGTSFRAYERRIREQLDRHVRPLRLRPAPPPGRPGAQPLGPRLRQPPAGLLLRPGRQTRPRDVLRRAPFGRIAFANTDLAGAMDHRNCFVESDRAVKQLLGEVFGLRAG